MPPETAAACVYNAASFIHVQTISKNRLLQKKTKRNSDSLNGDGAQPVNGREKNGNKAGSRRGVKS